MRRLSKPRVLVLICAAGLVAAVTFWATRSSCVDTAPGMRGEVWALPDGGFLYHNGTCWTSKPMPPRDTPGRF
jgi:hypothetical protein